MKRDIRRRLQKLESQVPPQRSQSKKTIEGLHWLFRFGVAYYLGDPTPEESVAEAYARALGYPNSYEFKKALKASDSDLDERMYLANTRLLEKFGIGWEERNWDAMEAALTRMIDGFSEFYAQQWYRIIAKPSA